VLMIGFWAVFLGLIFWALSRMHRHEPTSGGRQEDHGAPTPHPRRNLMSPF
jgi:hypothetical protein